MVQSGQEKKTIAVLLKKFTDKAFSIVQATKKPIGFDLGPLPEKSHSGFLTPLVLSLWNVDKLQSK